VRPGRARIALLLAVPAVAAAAPRAEAAEETGAAAARAPLTPGRRTAAVAAALVPGLILRGSGHFVAGEREAARRLLVAGGAGAGALLLGLTALAATGASRYTVGPLAAVSMTGAGLFLGSALADVYGVAVPAGGLGDVTPGPRWLVELGARYVANPNPTMSAEALSVEAITFRAARFRVGVEAQAALDEANARLRAPAALALWRPGAGTQVEVEIAVSHHHQGPGAVSRTLGEAGLVGRFDFGRLAPTMAGSFLDAAAGVAVGAARYHDLATEAMSLLTGGVGFGFRVGRGPRAGGEIAVFYDHRHDGFAEGLKARGLASGPLGHFGARADLFATAAWGVRLDAQVGSAIVAGASLLWRPGGPP
jgi:hypothetical protein